MLRNRTLLVAVGFLVGLIAGFALGAIVFPSPPLAPAKAPPAVGPHSDEASACPKPAEVGQEGWICWSIDDWYPASPPTP